MQKGVGAAFAAIVGDNPVSIYQLIQKDKLISQTDTNKSENGSSLHSG